MQGPLQSSRSGATTPGNEPRLVAAFVQPALLVIKNLQPSDQAGQLAVIQEVTRTGAIEPLQVGTGRLADDEQPVWSQRRGVGIEKRTPEKVGRQDQIPRARGEWLGL